MFAVVADNSQSMTHPRPRLPPIRAAKRLQALLDAEAGWQQRLGEDFDARRFAFDSHLALGRRFRRADVRRHRSSLTVDAEFAVAAVPRPAAGRRAAPHRRQCDRRGRRDLGRAAADLSGRDRRRRCRRPTVGRRRFGQPDQFRVGAGHRAGRHRGSGFAGQTIVASSSTKTARSCKSQTVECRRTTSRLAVRFQLRPEKTGVSFYRVHVSSDEGSRSRRAAEATLANNERLVVVDRGGGPYRVLYVCGRPNWEFKFLRRALAEDDQVELVGLVRIAKREPKFAFRSQAGESTNPLFRGFEHPDEEAAERYDQPVLVRLGTKDEDELRDGFPKTADELYRYDAVILDDVEADVLHAGPAHAAEELCQPPRRRAA